MGFAVDPQNRLLKVVGDVQIVARGTCRIKVLLD
jgi:hypothetical protein